MKAAIPVTTRLLAMIAKTIAAMMFSNVVMSYIPYVVDV